MDELFSIGDFCFRLVSPPEVKPPANFMKFQDTAKNPCYTYTVTLAQTLPEPVGPVLARREDMLVTEAPGGECRYIGVKGQPAPYARYVETSEITASIELVQSRLESLHVDPVFTSLLALERRLIDRDALVLHCAYVRHKGKALLFSAPSETGKTTQAKLWEVHRGSVTVNGDRALLQCVNGVWTAGGWPVCGTSGVCRNEDTPIGAIVVLSQAPTDQARPLSPAQAFSQLFSQITVNRWNRPAALRAMELLEQLVAAVPVFHLACTMNETAVQALEEILP